MENLSVAQGFEDTQEQERYAEVETALKQLLHHLTHLSKIWKVSVSPFWYSQELSSNHVFPL